MAIEVKHPFVSVKGDGADATKARPSDWNAAHNIRLDGGNVIGRLSAGFGDAEQIPFYSQTSTELTISSGTITVSGRFHRVDTEANASIDEVINILGGADGMMVTLRAEHSDRTVVVRTTLGNIRLGADMYLFDSHSTITLIYDGNLTNWIEIGRYYEHRFKTLNGGVTFYVRKDGSDSNIGLVNDASGAFLTFAKAMSVVSGIDQGNFNTAISFQAGETWTEQIAIRPWHGGGRLILEFNGGTITVSGNVGLTLWDGMGDGTFVQLYGAKFEGCTVGISVLQGWIKIENDCEFGECDFIHMVASGVNAKLDVVKQIDVSGGCNAHASVTNGASMQYTPISGGVVFTNSPDFSHAFMYAYAGGQITSFNMTHSGTVTGKRYIIGSDSFLGGDAPDYWPGDQDGVILGNATLEWNTDANGDYVNTITYTTTSELTIASGAITVLGSHHTVDTESDAGTDDLDTINGGWDGMTIILRPANGARTVVVKHNTGNIILRAGSDATLDDDTDLIILVYIEALSKWIQPI